MKQCPQCNRTYTDDALSFCLDDGSPLATVSAPPAGDSGATVQYPAARDTSPQPTIAYRPGQAPPPSQPPTPMGWTPTAMPPPQKRSVWPWLLGIGAVVVFIGIGLVILIFAIASITRNSNNNNRAGANNSNNSNWRSANRNSNSNSNSSLTSTNTNSNSGSSSSSFSDDFSAKSWGTGSSQYGDTWYQNDEYHMHAVKDGYIVMYAPDRGDYKLESGTVRVTLRSVEGTSPNAGYGLTVYGERKEGKLEDYGFLIYTGDSPQYKIVEHKGGVEAKLVDWTRTNAIRSGSSTNQIEIRVRDHKFDFYVNGQFITSITDSEGYKRGLVGFYTSGTPEVAFDDLQITRTE
jgi:hypothetical protein